MATGPMSYARAIACACLFSRVPQEEHRSWLILEVKVVSNQSSVWPQILITVGLITVAKNKKPS